MAGLERGKGRAELGLVLTALITLDLTVDPADREPARRASGMGPVDLDAVLDAQSRCPDTVNIGSQDAASSAAGPASGDKAFGGPGLW